MIVQYVMRITVWTLTGILNRQADGIREDTGGANAHRIKKWLLPSILPF